VNGVLLNYHDITDRFHAEEALRNSEAHYRQLYQASPAAYQSLDREGKILDVNPAWLEVLGYDREEILGQWFGDFLMPEYQDHFRNNFPRFKKKGEIRGVEFIMMRKDGSQIITSFQGRIVKGTRGEFKNTHCIFTNITEQKRAQDEILKFKTISDRASYGTAIASLKGHLIYLNDTFAQMHGYSPEELSGKSLSIFHNDDQIENVNKLNKQLVETGGYRGEEVWHTRKDGSVFPTLMSANVIKDDDGKSLYLSATATDISERMEDQEKIKASLKEKEIMLKEIHHRVKNNLQIIISLLNLQSQKLKDETVIKTFSESRNRIYSMALVHDKLYQSEDFSNIDFSDYISTMARHLFATYVSSDKISLELNVQPIDLGLDIAIPCGLIINELISNALKYAFPENRKGCLNISLKDTISDHYVLIVKDDGVGLPEKFNYEETDTLGLRLVQLLCEQINSILKIKSVKGTTFELHIKKQIDDKAFIN